MRSGVISGGDRGPVRSAAVAGLVLALACGGLAHCGQSGSTLPPRGVISEGPPLSLPPLPPSVTAEAAEQVAEPVRIRIPAIGVDAPVGPLHVNEHGVLPPPDGNHITGWWKQGPEPGEKGPAVIAGHVDSHQGPAVFFRLPELRTGETIFIDRADGSIAVFAAARIERHDKNAFPPRRSTAILPTRSCG